MSLISRHHHVPKPREGPAGPLSPRDEQKARALGLTSATGLVIGSIIGTGVFTMPAVLAGAGTSSLLVLAVIAVGAMLLAVLFGQLTRRVPNSDGGGTPTPGRRQLGRRLNSAVLALDPDGATGRLSQAWTRMTRGAYSPGGPADPSPHTAANPDTPVP